MNPDKEIALHKYIQSKLGLPFDFGSNDCPLLAFGALDIIADRDSSLREEYYGAWTSKKEAWAYADKHNTSIKKILMDAGCVEIDPVYASVGDFILLESSRDDDYKTGWRSVAVCLGIMSAAVTVENGVEVVDTHGIAEITGALRWQQQL